MNVRKYIVSDMQEGFERIRRELGRDAVILNQRTVRAKGLAGLFSRPRLEIHVAYEDMPARPAPAAPALPLQPAPVPLHQPTQMHQSAQSMQPAQPHAPAHSIQPAQAMQPAQAAQLIQPIQTALPWQVYQSAAAAAAPAMPPACQPVPSAYQPTPAAPRIPGAFQSAPTAPSAWPDSLTSRLLAVDVHPEVAAQLTGQAQCMAAVSGEDTRRVLHRLVMERLDDAPMLKSVPGARRLALFAGPAGVGKTTTILKLAAELGTQPGTIVGVLSADYSRAGAHAQLVTLGRLLRVPVAVIQSAAEVPAALDQLRSCDLVLIDTAGCNPLDAAQRNRLHELADRFQPDEVYLCLSASTTFSACRRMLEQFRFLDGYRLIINKTDEAPESGTVLNISSLAGRPPAYLTSGQQVPGQIQTCDARLLADRMMG